MSNQQSITLKTVTKTLPRSPKKLNMFMQPVQPKVTVHCYQPRYQPKKKNLPETILIEREKEKGTGTRES